MSALLPFPWLGRCLDSGFLSSTLSLRILLERPVAAALSRSLIDALPAPLQKGHLVVDGALVVVGTPRGASWEDGNKLGKRVAAAYKKSTSKKNPKPLPLQQFFDDVEAWLVRLHGEHPIALATVGWHPWIGPHARPTPSPSHAAALVAPPTAALRALAALVDDSDDRREVRELVTSTMFYLGDRPQLFVDVVTEPDLQRLFAHSWSTDEGGATLRLLGVHVDDDVLDRIAAQTTRLNAIVRSRGFSISDKHNVQTITTPLNTVWGVFSKLRLLALAEPLRPSVFFESDADAFFVRDESWGIDENVDGLASCDVGAAVAFMACHQRLIENRGATKSPGDERFRAHATRAIRWERRGVAADAGGLRWE